MTARILALSLASLLMAEASDQTSTAGANGTAPATDAATPAVAVVNGQELSYFFKTTKVKDDEGKEIGPGTKHPDVKVVVPMPTITDAINYLAAADGTKEAKVRDLIMDSLKETIFLAGRRQINEWLEKNEGKTFTATDMDLSKLTLQAISELPKGQRGAWAPSEEDMKDFNEAYTEVLVHVKGYDPKKTKTHTDHWKNGMAKVKTNKPVVSKLKDFLTVFAASATEEQMEEVEPTYSWLQARADRYINAEDKNFLDAL